PREDISLTFYVLFRLQPKIQAKIQAPLKTGDFPLEESLRIMLGFLDAIKSQELTKLEKQKPSPYRLRFIRLERWIVGRGIVNSTDVGMFLGMLRSELRSAPPAVTETAENAGWVFA